VQTGHYSQTFFQYTGKTSLTVVGGATGTRYHFDSPGAVVATDFRDQASLLAIPMLHRVHQP